jgi:mRNA interferase MazF
LPFQSELYEQIMASEVTRDLLSLDSLNHALPRVIIAPLTTKGQALGCRPEVVFNGRESRILLDQIRTVDKVRLVGKLGSIKEPEWHPVLMEMLA